MHFIKEIGNKIKKQVWDLNSLTIVIFIKEIIKIIIQMALEFTSGELVKNIKEIGSKE